MPLFVFCRYSQPGEHIAFGEYLDP